MRESVKIMRQPQWRRLRTICGDVAFISFVVFAINNELFPTRCVHCFRHELGDTSGVLVWLAAFVALCTLPFEFVLKIRQIAAHDIPNVSYEDD